VHGVCLGVASIDVPIDAVLFHDKNVLTDRENPEERLCGQLVEVCCAHLRLGRWFHYAA